MNFANAPRRLPPRGRTVFGDFANVGEAIVKRHRGRAWPAERWQKDPVGFAGTILGAALWSEQVKILEAIRDHDRVAISGGRKVGKDFALGVAALWWYGSFPDALVFMTATTSAQIDEILYVEIRRLYSRSGVCLACKVKDPRALKPPPCPHSAILAGDVGILARTGIVSTDFRRIFGRTAAKAEGLQGVSGPRILAIADEASGIDDDLHVALRGNLAAEGCKEVLISNPTRPSGFFFDAFHRHADRYETLTIPSTSSPNVVEGREVYPGLASRAWIQECKEEWGENSALYKVHVLAEFVEQEAGAVFPVHALAEAEARWADTPAEGALQIGLDPSGEGTKGDETGFAVRRGKKMLLVGARTGLSAEAHLVEVLGLIQVHGEKGEEIIVAIDREGETGAKVWGVFVAYVQAHEGAFVLRGVRSSERARRRPEIYDRVRDELAANLADWLRDGGALVPDVKLAKDLSAFRWVEHISGRSKILAKDEMRKVLGRSPDRGDAVALAVWGSSTAGATAVVVEQVRRVDAYEAPPDVTFDPYAGMNPWRT